MSAKGKAIAASAFASYTDKALRQAIIMLDGAADRQTMDQRGNSVLDDPGMVLATMRDAIEDEQADRKGTK